MTKGTDIRELALGILLEVSAGEEYSHIALRNVLDKYQYLEKQERAFLTRLVEGTLERRIELDYIIDQFSSVKVKKQKPQLPSLPNKALKYPSWVMLPQEYPLLPLKTF